MKAENEQEYSIVPQKEVYEGIPEKDVSEKSEKNRIFKENVKNTFLQYGLGVAATVLTDAAKQGVSLAGRVMNDVGEHGKGGSARESKQSLKEKLKDGLMDHVWGLVDSLDDDLGDRNKEFNESMRETLSDRFGKGLIDIAFTANDIKNDMMALKVAKNLRQTMGSSDDERDAGLEIPADVQCFTNIRYGDDAKWNLLDIYRPAGKAGRGKYLRKLPVIVNFHGGAWIYGDKERYKYYCASLSQRGFAVVNYSYRLAPENKFPSSLIDTNNVFRWMNSNSREYGLDMNNIFAMGDSAGANIAGLYICVLTNEEYAQNYDFKPPAGLKIRAAAFNCGAFDPLRFMSEKEMMKGLVVQDDSMMRAEILNVTDNMTSDFPPVYLMSCIGDFCRKYVEPMTMALEKFGIEHSVKVYGTEEEPFSHVFHLSVRNDTGAECSDRECSFFRNYMVKNTRNAAR